MYLNMVMSAVIITLCIGALLSYVLLFAGNSGQQNSPDVLVRAAYVYVNIDNQNVNIDEDYINRIEQGNVWIQILDKAGKCLYEYNVPKDIPREYSIFELTEYCMKSDELPGYTLFYSTLKNAENYGVIIGCDSDVVRKISYIDDVTIANEWLLMALIFLVTAIIVVVASSLIFSRKISRPVADIIENISEISYGEYVEKEQKSNLFKDVFVKLKRLHNTLKQNEKMRAEWIANISHDLKSPLSTIKGYAEILQNSEYEITKEEVGMFANEIHNAEETMYTLIEDLKTSQKLKEGKIVLNKSDNDVVEILHSCVKDVDSNLLGNSKVIFNNKESIIISCDRELIKRCFQNIICNAFIHNPNEIILTIEVNQKEHYVEIIIEDNGIGMAEKDKEHIFERYYRGTDSQKTNGTGLGLAIAKEIIEVHNGKIDVTSIAGNGTKFNIVL